MNNPTKPGHVSESLEKLGEGTTRYDYTTEDQILEAFQAPESRGVYVVELLCPEFTSRCPKTNQPDFGKIVIQYVPSTKCVESKSLKLYLGAFREEGHFHEQVIQKIHDDLVELMSPVWIRVRGDFYPRGGISINPITVSGMLPAELVGTV